ncbi:MAG TPA: PAS domain-containing protein [Sphingobium sp.]
MPAWTQGLLLTDSGQADNPVIFATRGFTTLTGYAAAEIVGRNCRFLQGPDTDRRTVAAIREAVAARRRFDGDILNYRKDGRPFWNHLSIGPVTTEASETLLVGLQFDVSFRHSEGR